MEFKINNRKWIIKEVTQDEIKEIENETELNGNIFGLTIYEKQTIYLWKDMAEEQKRQTLLHELMHCYIGCYVSFQDLVLNEEVMCHISANSHDIIHKIITDYFEE